VEFKNIHAWDDITHALEVAAGEFVVATATAADIEAYEPLSALLRRVQGAFGIEAAFVSDHHAARETDALQRHYGMQLLGASGGPGRFRFEALPVISGEGAWRGTLCCRVPVKAGIDDRQALESVAQLIAKCFADAEPAV
jgi:hypothetical protein